MKLSNSYFFTLREKARDEDSPSGNLLVRSGMIKKSSTGAYMMLPLGLRVLRKIEDIIRDEMEKIGSQEVTMPALIPEDVYIESGRREGFGDSMFSLKDRYDRPYVLGPTHEELFAAAAKMYIHSYKDFPVSLFQFQNKFRDEPRPRFGLIRVREFIMKDAYTFDKDLDGLDKSYEKMFRAYHNIFKRLGLDYVVVRADTGVMGGLLSEEFQALSPIGEDILVIEKNSGYAANLEVAGCILSGEPSQEPYLEIEEVDTPNAGTIEEVSAFLGKPKQSFVKTLLYIADDKPVAFSLRGDHELNETKALKLLGVTELRMADPEEVERFTGAPVGFAGPIDLKVPLIVDQEVSLLRNFVIGANKKDVHFINVNLKDFEYKQIADIREICEGDMCENGAGPVHFIRGIEVGNTFKLGDKYSKAMDLYYMDASNERLPVIMGSYGIGPARCMAAIVEQNHNENGILWPKDLAPVQVAIIIANMKDELQTKVAEELYSSLQSTGLDICLDDRDERIGVKFKDMELIGAYCRIVVGRGASEGKVELERTGFDKEILPLEDMKERLHQIFEKEKNEL